MATKAARATVTGLGLLALAVGMTLILRGTAWNLSLGEARFLVGGAFIAFGIYAIVTAVRGKP